MNDPPHVPTGGPALARGRHRDPAEGACLMEYTALLAGEAHTDRPGSVHPVLTAIGHVTNDALADAERAELAPLAARMLGTHDPDRRLLGQLLDLCCQRGLEVALPIWAPRLRRGRRQAARHAASNGAATQRQLAKAAATARVAAAALVVASDDRAEVLTALLGDCLDLIERVARVDPPERRLRSASTVQETIVGSAQAFGSGESSASNSSARCAAAAGSRVAPSRSAISRVTRDS